MFNGKLNSVIWFLKRPKLYPQFLHLLKLKLLSRPEPDTRAESERWCEQNAISMNEAIERITGSPMDEPIEQKYAAVFREAHAKANSCPVVMGGPGALDLLYWVSARLKAKRVIETGVAYGWSSLALLLAFEENCDSQLISTDMPYIQGNNDTYVGLVVPEQLKRHWELIRLSDRQALPRAIQKLGQLDLCHYDSDKSYAGRLWAYPKLWSALRAGGCFISDDIDDNFGFRDFASQVGSEPIVVRIENETQKKYVGILTKKG
jgi:predicted O-methyltransferase YrrM